MRVLTPWICVLLASVQPVFAANDYEAYRLGDYNQASHNLVQMQDKAGVADYYLGRIYLYGYGQLKNESLALRYFEKSASKGYVPAQLLMGKYALLQAHDPAGAFGWFKKAALNGDMSARMYVSAAYLFGVGVKENSDVARQFYIEAAKNGNSIAQYELARHFLSSKQASNKKLGFIWLQKAVNSGNPRAQVELANLFLTGQLVAQDSIKANELLLQSAQQNYVPAMLKLANIAIANQAWNDAVSWYQKAAAKGSKKAQYLEAKLYLTESSPLYNRETGYINMLKMAQDNYAPAQKNLADLYKQGIGTEKNDALAEQWEARAKQTEAANGKNNLSRLAYWLSNGVSRTMENTAYQLGGIFNAWHNTNALKDNNYNAAPQRQGLSRYTIFQPDYSMIQPNDISISDYYDALVSNQDDHKTPWAYPGYPLNAQIVALQKSGNKEESGNATEKNNTENKNQYSSLINYLSQRAAMGDAEAQFDLGQLYEQGVGVAQNIEQAAFWYQNAADQQHSGAEYSLAVLHLKKATPQDYKIGKSLLMVSAFKGNSYSQYVLSKILREPTQGASSPFDDEQGLSMLYLASANGYGRAQYDLAEHLAKNQVNDFTVTARAQRIQRIRGLYASAAESGIREAALPLAYYNAMQGQENLQKQAFAVALEEAKRGNGKAALLVGLLYDRGTGTVQDHAQAMQWYQKAQAGPVSDFIVGTYHSNPNETPENKSTGKAMLSQAANQDFPFAYFNLAVLNKDNQTDFLHNLQKSYSLGNSKAGILLADYYLASGEDAEKMQEARNIYAGLAQKGDENAQMKLAYMFEKGLGSNVDYAQAEQWYLRSAVQGNAMTRFLLGEFYQTGVLGTPDYHQALAWYQKAAEQLPIASVAAGFLYETVFDDYANAKKAYEAAAGKQNPVGEYDLALMLENGKGHPTDVSRAAELYDSAARQGYSPAMTQLANMYFTGTGREKNQEQALSWYRKAAEQGNDMALYELGLLSETGMGTAQQSADALIYYKNAANKGNEKAIMALARMYDYGFGVNRNAETAHKFYKTLAEKNNGYAQYQLARKYRAENDWSRLPPEGMKLLATASENGNYQANVILRRLAAQSKDKTISYLEPVLIQKEITAAESSASHLYMEALNAWNHGDEALSHSLLKKLIKAYPDYEPAKKAWDAIEKDRNDIYG